MTVRDHRGEDRSGFDPPSGGWAHSSDGTVIRDHRSSPVKHIFVLMMENRSFDHMLGFSGIVGTDAATSAPTEIEGLTSRGRTLPSFSNSFNGRIFVASNDAGDRVAKGPGHDFPAVLAQLCGPDATYSPHGAYPPITNSGFVSNYSEVGAEPDQLGDVMRCFDPGSNSRPSSLPVLTQLAREFVVCDHWFSSMPGATEPNRMFVHAATSADWDDSPGDSYQLGASVGSVISTIGDVLAPWAGLPAHGLRFAHGTIYRKLTAAGLRYRIYADDWFPNVGELDDISRTDDIHSYDDFAADVNSADYDAAYTFIEPDYDTLHISEKYLGGNSQHPRGSVAAGEQLIKDTYEAIRRSPLWGQSMLIVTYDEHGGFFDHVTPPSAPATGSVGSKFGFTFDRLGPRVPTIVISPLAPRNLVEHRVFDHCAVLATVERTFGLSTLNERDKLGSDLNHLLTLETPRTDAPMTLDPARTPESIPAERITSDDTPLSDCPDNSVITTLHSAVLTHTKLTPPSQHDAIMARPLRTYGDARAYVREVRMLAMAVRSPRLRAKQRAPQLSDTTRAAQRHEI